jgi:aspartate-semialdehyde dehydrogenase
MSYKVAVVGATGNVGREMLNILHERQFPVSELVALASRRSIGKEVTFGDKTIKTKCLDDYDFTGTDIVSNKDVSSLITVPFSAWILMCR